MAKVYLESMSIPVALEISKEKLGVTVSGSTGGTLSLLKCPVFHLPNRSVITEGDTLQLSASFR